MKEIVPNIKAEISSRVKTPGNFQEFFFSLLLLKSSGVNY
jgi:hypothetical protein